MPEVRIFAYYYRNITQWLIFVTPRIICFQCLCVCVFVLLNHVRTNDIQGNSFIFFCALKIMGMPFYIKRSIRKKVNPNLGSTIPVTKPSRRSNFWTPYPSLARAVASPPCSVIPATMFQASPLACYKIEVVFFFSFTRRPTFQKNTSKVVYELLNRSDEHFKRFRCAQAVCHSL